MITIWRACSEGMVCSHVSTMAGSFRVSGVLRKHQSVWIVLGLLVGLAVCSTEKSKNCTADELTASRFPHNVSNNIYSDPCESDPCGGMIHQTSGTIISPSFPDLYPPNKICVWEIIARPQYRIILNFTLFHLEQSFNCICDSLNISSKMADGEARNHGVFCGSRLPPLITSEGNYLRIEFRSDNSFEKSGFSAFFSTDKDQCATNNGWCQHICNYKIGSYACSCHDGFELHENLHDCVEGSCSYQRNSSHGEIISPNYRHNYTSRKDCDWLITATPGHRIKLVFNDFELENNQECAYEHIAAYDGDSDQSPTLGKFCGSKAPPHILASGNRMYLVLKLYKAGQRSGFNATYSTVCGGRLLAHNEFQFLYSHVKYGNQNYDNNANCDWVVRGLNHQRVKLHFITFDVGGYRCFHSYVDVYDGEDDSAKKIGTFCGNKAPSTIYSSGDSLMVRFRSNFYRTSKGFSATYKAVNSVMAENATLKSPLVLMLFVLVWKLSLLVFF